MQPKLGILLAVVLLPTPLGAQDTTSRPTTSQGTGFQVRTVSGYVGYYSSTLPNGAGIQPGTTALSGDLNLGGSTVISWTKFTERSTLSLTYTPSYTGRVRYSSTNAFNHALTLNTSHKLAPRWSVNFSVNADLSSIEQALFAPTALGNALSVRSTFDDLSSGFLFSKFTNNPQLGSVLTTAPLQQSPVNSLLYGQRMFTSAASSSLSYSYSPRLSVSFGGGAGRSQRLSDHEASTRDFNPPLIANTTSVSANASISYSLSPRSQIGGTVNATRTISSIQDFYSTNALLNYGRTMGRRWFTQLHGGMGVIRPVGKAGPVKNTKPSPTGGGSLGFKTFSQSIIGSYERSVGDSYGIGATGNSSAMASWRFGRPGSGWWIESSVGWQQLRGNALIDISGWNSSVGYGRTINQHLTVLTQYAYLFYSVPPQSLRTVNYNLSQSAVRVSMVWSPKPTVQ